MGSNKLLDEYSAISLSKKLSKISLNELDKTFF